jgi:hypothetical protein
MLVLRKVWRSNGLFGRFSTQAGSGTFGTLVGFSGTSGTQVVCLSSPVLDSDSLSDWPGTQADCLLGLAFWRAVSLGGLSGRSGTQVGCKEGLAFDRDVR